MTFEKKLKKELKNGKTISLQKLWSFVEKEHKPSKNPKKAGGYRCF